MSEVLQELEFSIGSFGEDGGRERLHDLLDRDRLACQLIFRRALPRVSKAHGFVPEMTLTRPGQRLPCPRVAGRCILVTVSPILPFSLFALEPDHSVYLLVISKVVPKIWARTNSAILSGSLNRPSGERDRTVNSRLVNAVR
jgi:hypothetical protein